MSTQFDSIKELFNISYEGLTKNYVVSVDGLPVQTKDKDQQKAVAKMIEQLITMCKNSVFNLEQTNLALI